ncbi:MAG: bifunctional DNA-formamidopyrimidine glycosylase/DNA-(apurinic or apyrimidinic site) lyase [Actinomycetota bacterium]|jgi:formamidopyrimidine-DNA glycosylase|nr:bifunctional DNA-formamidopyrimidine glycosylase/DNA-(apurinic or apyrimidinic site) lyase [Actinomycetota bacterium]
MPELPEVETIRVQLDPLVSGSTVVEAWSHPSAKFTPARDVTGATISSTSRRGKYLLLELGDGRDLVVHLGMTGQLHLGDEIADDRYVRAWWQLDDGRRLMFRDVRRFGRLAVTPRGDHRSIPTLRAMGPEPFDPTFTGRAMWERLRMSKQHIKTQLLSQRPVAGVGNIYADEALFLAGINPIVRRISPERSDALLDAIRLVLDEGLARGGTTLRDYRSLEGSGSNQFHLRCYGRAGQPCVECSDELRGRVIDARSTTWCATCQR